MNRRSTWYWIVLLLGFNNLAGMVKFFPAVQADNKKDKKQPPLLTTFLLVLDVKEPDIFEALQCMYAESLLKISGDKAASFGEVFSKYIINDSKVPDGVKNRFLAWQSLFKDVKMRELFFESLDKYSLRRIVVVSDQDLNALTLKSSDPILGSAEFRIVSTLKMYRCSHPDCSLITPCRHMKQKEKFPEEFLPQSPLVSTAIRSIPFQKEIKSERTRRPGEEKNKVALSFLSARFKSVFMRLCESSKKISTICSAPKTAQLETHETLIRWRKMGAT